MVTAQPDKLHFVEEIAPATYRISEVNMINCYLAVGSESALLIDAGLGLGNLRAVVESLTKLPVAVVATHAHCDHVLGANWYESYFLHKDDFSFVYRILSSKIFGKALAAGQVEKSAFLKQPYRAKRIPIEDGHVFRLGEREITVQHVPGHTRGSIILLDKKHQIMFTGDDTNPNLLLQIPGATSLETWLFGAEQILAFAQDYAGFYGHDTGRQPREQIETTIGLGKAVLAMQPKNAVIPKYKIQPSKEEAKKENAIVLRYRTSHVHNKKARG
jgi:hydroxyacylglutathione hydrolase